MRDKGQTKTASGFDTFKWVLVLVIVGLGVFGNNYYANDYSVLDRTLALLPMAAVAIFIALQTIRGGALWQLMKESRAEIRRVVWPTRQETTQTAMVVILVVLVMAMILWGLDTFLNWLISYFIG